MITTFIDMRKVLLGKLAAIIGAALLLVACSATRLAYNNAPQLAWWWLDGYLDFGSEQTPRVKEQLERWLAWHRQTQLLDYAGFLDSLQPLVGAAATPTQMCGWYEQVRQRLRPVLDRGLQAAAEISPSLQPQQIVHLETRFAKSNANFRKDFMQPDREARRKAALERSVENAERFYGKLTSVQRQLLQVGLDDSPFDPGLWQSERERRQRDILELLRRWQADRPDRDQALAALRQLSAQAERSPDPAYRRYQVALTEHNCRLSAELHNSMSAKQRDALRQQLAEWEGDLRALAAQQASP